MVYSMEYMYLKRAEGGASDVLESTYLPSKKALVGKKVFFPLLPSAHPSLWSVSSLGR